MMKSMVDTQKVLKQLREKVDREIQGAEADIESIRKALTIPEKRPRLRRKRRTKYQPIKMDRMPIPSGNDVTEVATAIIETAQTMLVAIRNM